mmetsp:Transcript_47282/g.119915  ORF Transcript_47282/g.119915 Transcript_47282/m.119915 type:complete len:682 (-) Transcript_47282:190-2235(-)
MERFVCIRNGGAALVPPMGKVAVEASVPPATPRLQADGLGCKTRIWVAAVLGVATKGSLCGLLRKARSTRTCRTRRRQAGVTRAEDPCVHIHVPIRQGRKCVTLKRFLRLPAGGVSLRSRPATLLINDGPGLPSCYLDPLATRISEKVGRTVYLYDQLGCGLSPSDEEGDSSSMLEDRLQMDLCIGDLKDVLSFLCEELGERGVHLAGHGFGGVVLMEAVVRKGLWSKSTADKAGDLASASSGIEFPQLESVILIGVPASAMTAEAEARRLLRDAEEAVGPVDAAHSFWCRHMCALYPQPRCLREAYAQAGDRDKGWWGFGALQGCKWTASATASSGGGQWELREGSVLRDWEMQRAEVAELYAAASRGAPLLSIRGTHDFVTEACVDAWRGVGDAASSSDNLVFQEEVVAGCGHNPHLESPRVFANKLHDWLLRCEGDHEGSGHASRAGQSAQQSDGPELLGGPGFTSLRLLDRGEARQQLSRWASEFARADPSIQERWAFEWQLAARHRVAERYWKSPLPSREARMLAEWAWALPEAGMHASVGEAHLHHHHAILRAGLAAVLKVAAADHSASVAAAEGSRLWAPMALGLCGTDGRGPDAIVCVEVSSAPRIVSAMSSHRGGAIGSPARFPVGEMAVRLIGAAAPLRVPRGTRDRAVHWVGNLISEITDFRVAPGTLAL